MFSGCLTHFVIRILDWLAARIFRPDGLPEHQRTGRSGEEAAYFYLRRLGYTIIARNFRSPLHRGELDLVGWDKDVLCFIEVKTRTTRDVKPAEAAVDREKQKDLQYVAHDFLRQLPATAASARSVGAGSDMPPSCQWRFDILAVYYEHPDRQPSFELFQNAFSVS
jgi:putative endonuclease